MNEAKDVLCHLDGEPCYGDPNFCEECYKMLDEE